MADLALHVDIGQRVVLTSVNVAHSSDRPAGGLPSTYRPRH